MDAHLHAAGVAVADLDMRIDDHGLADEAHGAHADGISKLGELELQFRDFRIWVAVADGAQTGGPLAVHHAGVL